MSKIINYEQYRDFMLSLATKHKLLNPGGLSAEPNFYEFEDSFSGNGLKYPCMILAPEKNREKDDESDNTIRLFECEFWILYQVKRESKAEKSAAWVNSEKIGRAIISKIKKAYKTWPDDPADKQIHVFHPESVAWEKIGPMPQGNDYGTSFQFTFGNPDQNKEDPTEWW